MEYCKGCGLFVNTDGARTIKSWGKSKLIIDAAGRAHTIVPEPKPKINPPIKSAEQVEDKDVE